MRAATVHEVLNLVVGAVIKRHFQTPESGAPPGDFPIGVDLRRVAVFVLPVVHMPANAKVLVEPGGAHCGDAVDEVRFCHDDLARNEKGRRWPALLYYVGVWVGFWVFVPREQ